MGPDALDADAPDAFYQHPPATSSSVNIRRWTYVRYCQSAMVLKLFSTGPGSFRRAGRKEAIDGLDQTSCDSLFHSEMVLGKKEYL